LYSPLEKAFARFAREQTVMVTRHLVAAHGTQFLDALFGVGQLATGGGRIDGGGSGGGGCGGGGRHGRTAAVAADGHVLLETVHGTGHAASTTVTTCGTEQIRRVHITQLITALLITSAHHRVRGGRAGRGRLVLGRHVLIQWRR